MAQYVFDFISIVNKCRNRLKEKQKYVEIRSLPYLPHVSDLMLYQPQLQHFWLLQLVWFDAEDVVIVTLFKLF